jgi:hypothetical protein
MLTEGRYTKSPDGKSSESAKPMQFADAIRNYVPTLFTSRAATVPSESA